MTASKCSRTCRKFHFYVNIKHRLSSTFFIILSHSLYLWVEVCCNISQPVTNSYSGQKKSFFAFFCKRYFHWQKDLHPASASMCNTIRAPAVTVNISGSIEASLLCLFYLKLLIDLHCCIKMVTKKELLPRYVSKSSNICLSYNH